MKVIKLSIILVLVQSPVFLKGQVNLYPAAYGVVSHAVLISNPALNNAYTNWELNSGNQFYPGNYRSLQNHYFSGTYNLTKDSLSRKHNIGLKLLSEKEGDFISRPKVYASYSIHTRIINDYRLAAGVNLGYAGFVYKATNISAEGSDFGLDGDLALAFYNRTFKIGLAVNQITNSTLVPKSLTFRYRRFYSFYLQKILRIDNQNHFALNFGKQLRPQIEDLNSIGLSLIFHKVIEIGSNVLLSENISFIGGVRQLKLLEVFTDVTFCYRVPTSFQSRSNIQSFEIMLSCYGLSLR